MMLYQLFGIRDSSSTYLIVSLIVLPSSIGGPIAPGSGIGTATLAQATQIVQSRQSALDNFRQKDPKAPEIMRQMAVRRVGSCTKWQH